MAQRDDVRRDEILQQAVEATMDGVALLDQDSEYIYLNDSHASIYGYDDPADLLGENWRTLYSDDEVARLEREVLPELDREGEWRGTATGRRRDGTTFAQDLSLTYTDSDHLVCVVRDVSERAGHRKQLERYETILTNIRDGVYTLDESGTITWVNGVAVDEFGVGYDRSELVGEPVSKVLSDEDVTRCLDLIRDLVHNDPSGSRRCEIDIQTAYGDEIPCDLHLTLLPAEGGGFAGTVGVVRDISERKRREQRLSVLNRVLRHNLRNEANVILGHVERLVREHEVDEAAVEPLREAVQTVSALGNKARKMEQRLAAPSTATGTVDVAESVRAVAGKLADSEPAATVSVDAPAHCRVQGSDSLELAIEQLLENALEHVEEPTVTIELEAEGDRVCLAILDDGPGIPEMELDSLERGEQPLQHGSGLGLWIAKWCVENSGGSLSFAESPSGGTAATLTLRPAAESQSDGS